MYMGLCGVGLWAYSTKGMLAIRATHSAGCAFGNQIKLIGNQVSEKLGGPYRNQTKEYFSWLISRNRDLLASLSSRIKKIILIKKYTTSQNYYIQNK